MGTLDDMAGDPEGGGETDDLDAHLHALLGRKATPEMKSAFRAAVHVCMDEYGAEEEEAPVSVASGAKPSGY